MGTNLIERVMADSKLSVALVVKFYRRVGMTFLIPNIFNSFIGLAARVTF